MSGTHVETSQVADPCRNEVQTVTFRQEGHRGKGRLAPGSMPWSLILSNNVFSEAVAFMRVLIAKVSKEF